MKLKWNVAAQVLGTIMQFLNANGSMVPAKYQVEVALAVGIVQALSAFVAHFSNPDGTPAEAPYKK
jgi:hypothetical protein